MTYPSCSLNPKPILSHFIAQETISHDLLIHMNKCTLLDLKMIYFFKKIPIIFTFILYFIFQILRYIQKKVFNTEVTQVYPDDFNAYDFETDS